MFEEIEHEGLRGHVSSLDWDMQFARFRKTLYSRMLVLKAYFQRDVGLKHFRKLSVGFEALGWFHFG